MKRVLKRLGLVLGGLVGVLLFAGATAYALGSRAVGRTYEVQTAALRVSDDSASVAHGAHLAAIHGCTDCHGPDLGGQVFVDAPPFRLTASNLTRGEGGVGARYTDADWDRTVRHGVKPDGRAVIVMPAAAYHRLADEDAADLIAYLKRLRPVNRALPPSDVRTLGRLLAAGPLDASFEVSVTPARATAPPSGPTATYGAYLASITCAYCHGADLRGAQPPNPDSPPAPDLAAAGAWTYPQFARALQTGVRPAGAPLDPHVMPWRSTAAMTSDELKALYAFLGTLGERASSAPDA
ncbi:MAG TPA: c-type cytochrome [Rubricoccaceae bacterium]|jgi:cytochrome c553